MCYQINPLSEGLLCVFRVYHLELQNTVVEISVKNIYIYLASQSETYFVKIRHSVRKCSKFQIL